MSIHPLVSPTVYYLQAGTDQYIPKKGTEAEKWVAQYAKYHSTLMEMTLLEDTPLEIKANNYAAGCFLMAPFSWWISFCAPAAFTTPLIAIGATCCVTSLATKCIPHAVQERAESKYNEAVKKLIELIEKEGFENFESIDLPSLNGRAVHLVLLD